jgi:hypothetical protein
MWLKFDYSVDLIVDKFLDEFAELVKKNIDSDG